MTYKEALDIAVHSDCDCCYNDQFECGECNKAIKILNDLVEKADKYRWHDLRKNPEDLPEDGDESLSTFEIALEYKIFSIRRVYSHAKRLKTEDGVYWYDVHGKGYLNHPRYNDITGGGTNQYSVLKWRYIDPAEEEV